MGASVVHAEGGGEGHRPLSEHPPCSPCHAGSSAGGDGVATWTTSLANASPGAGTSLGGLGEANTSWVSPFLPKRARKKNSERNRRFFYSLSHPAETFSLTGLVQPQLFF